MADGVDDIFTPDLPTPVTLTRCDNGELASAKLVELTTKLAKTKINGAWWRGLRVSAAKRQAEGDHHWDWASEVGRHRNKLYFDSVAIQTADNDIQGAAIYRIDGRSILTAGAGALIIHWLATAPRNRSWLVPRPVYRGVGVNLIRWAAFCSIQLGFGGRIVLASLPTQRTIAFYEMLGFQATSVEEDDMLVYELQAEQAIYLLRGQRGSL